MGELDSGVAFRNTVFDGAKEVFEQEGECAPVALILAQRSPDGSDRFDRAGFGLVVVRLEMSEWCDRCRDEMAEKVTKLTSDCEAIACGLIYEAWVTSVADDSRREVVIVTIDHAREGHEVWMADIEREDGSVALGEFKRAPAGPVSGKFAGLLHESCYEYNVVEA